MKLSPQYEWYLEQGFVLLPLSPLRPGMSEDESKTPRIKWKKYQTERPSRDDIESWVGTSTTNRFCILCGEVSDNLVDLDIDKEEIFEKLNLGIVAANTYTEVRTTETGERKFHIFLKATKPIKHKTLSFDGHEEISIRFNADLINAAGTSYIAGGKYEHFPTSPKKIKTVEPGFFSDLEKLWNDYHGLNKEGKKGFSGFKKGIKVTTPLLEIIKECVEGEEGEDKKLEGFVDSGDYCQFRCPFKAHKDPTPSFTLYKNTNSFYCFGCGKGGNAINFLSEFYGISKKDAEHQLREAGKVEQEEADSPTAGKSTMDRWVEELEQAKQQTYHGPIHFDTETGLFFTVPLPIRNSHIPHILDKPFAQSRIIFLTEFSIPPW